jgi:hypothetical protein
VQQFGKGLADEQEVLMFCADAIIDTFAADSVVQRAEASGSALHRAIASIFVNDALARVETAARNALAHTGDPGRARLTELRTMMSLDSIDTIPLRQQVAEAVLTQKRYPFA